MPIDDIAYQLVIQAEIAVYHVVSQAGYLPPRNVRMLIAEVERQLLDGFADDLNAPFDAPPQEIVGS